MVQTIALKEMTEGFRLSERGEWSNLGLYEVIIRKANVRQANPNIDTYIGKHTILPASADSL